MPQSTEPFFKYKFNAHTSYGLQSTMACNIFWKFSAVVQGRRKGASPGKLLRAFAPECALIVCTARAAADRFVKRPCCYELWCTSHLLQVAIITVVTTMQAAVAIILDAAALYATTAADPAVIEWLILQWQRNIRQQVSQTHAVVTC
jgi:hypothetical protein